MRFGSIMRLAGAGAALALMLLVPAGVSYGQACGAGGPCGYGPGCAGPGCGVGILPGSAPGCSQCPRCGFNKCTAFTIYNPTFLYFQKDYISPNPATGWKRFYGGQTYPGFLASTAGTGSEFRSYNFYLPPVAPMPAYTGPPSAAVPVPVTPPGSETP
jgi:hypothetical protein